MAALGLLSVLASRPARAWVYPEHRDITAEALRELSPDRRHVIEEMWSSARRGADPRYCGAIIEGDGMATPSCIDLAAWPAIAADHSCSPTQFLATVPSAEWIMRVAEIGAETKVALRNARSREQTFNEWALSHLKMQIADQEYTSRSTSNKGHFLATRESNELHRYMAHALAADTRPNAMGNYVYYHLGALAMARGWSSIDAAARPALARDILATETLALHFLEDLYSAGHVAGTWGGVAEQKGTHDYYSEFGIDAALWSGNRATLLGDAHMRDADFRRTAAAASASFAQLADAASDANSPAGRIAATVSPSAMGDAVQFDTCTATQQPTSTIVAGSEALVTPIASQTPMPGLPEEEVHLPRFRQEFGPFLGFFGDLSGAASLGGYQASGSPRVYGASNVGFRFGVGLEALTGSSGSAQAFVGIGLQYETAQRESGQSFYEVADLPVVPARRGLSLQFRVPFYIVPFDLLLVAPILAWASPGAMKNMAIVAASGGRLGLHRAILTRVGSFQVLLGTEVGLTLYGYVGQRIENIAIAGPGATVPFPSNNAAFISYRSAQIDIPFFEYRPIRTFSTQQALTFALQFGGGFEFLNDVEYVSKLTLPAATGPVPDLGTAWFLYLRAHFDARYYF
jgi:hypothetical protein